MRDAGRGRIIFMASQLGIVADPGATLYGMTKAALIHLARSLALELAAEGITVNAVSPGPIGTSTTSNGCSASRICCSVASRRYR